MCTLILSNYNYTTQPPYFAATTLMLLHLHMSNGGSGEWPAQQSIADWFTSASSSGGATAPTTASERFCASTAAITIAIASFHSSVPGSIGNLSDGSLSIA